MTNKTAKQFADATANKVRRGGGVKKRSADQLGQSPARKRTNPKRNVPHRVELANGGTMPVSGLAPKPPPVMVLYRDLAPEVQLVFEVDAAAPRSPRGVPVYGQYPAGLTRGPGGDQAALPRARRRGGGRTRAGARRDRRRPSMTLAEAVATGWPFRRKGMVRWMEATESGQFVLLRTDARGGDRSLLAREAEPHSILASDLTSDDWEILVWNSGVNRQDGIYSDLAVLRAPAADVSTVPAGVSGWSTDSAK